MFRTEQKKRVRYSLDSIRPVASNDCLLGNLLLQEQEEKKLLPLVAHAAEERAGEFDNFLEVKGILHYNIYRTNHFTRPHINLP